MQPLLGRLLAVLAIVLLTTAPGYALAAGPAVGLAPLARNVETAREKLEAGDAAGARAAYQIFDDGWAGIEDGIRVQSRSSYRAIEDAMGDARYALAAEPFVPEKARAALLRLQQECDAFIAGAGGAAAASPASNPSNEPVTLSSVAGHLENATAHLDAGNPAAAAAEVGAFRREWVDVEGAVKTRSVQVYTDTENNMARAYAQLTQQPPDVAGARETLARMQTDLAPFVDSTAHYGVFDAAIILFREGLEALLVLGALVAFLKRTGNGAKTRWIWAGSGAGVAASLVVAVIISLVFSRAAAGANRELLEGLTGLVAAGMLVYVSYWLHSKASIGAWQRYIRDRSTAALASNSLLSLALIAFLAVFREGAETVLFYVGIAPSITLPDLLIGLGLGAAALVVIGVLLLLVGVRIPIRPFFFGTGILVYYLAFKFVGTGLHALQVAGALSATPAPYIPGIDLIGVYPTIETTAVQALLLLLAVAVVLLTRLRASAEARTVVSAS